MRLEAISEKREADLPPQLAPPSEGRELTRSLCSRHGTYLYVMRLLALILYLKEVLMKHYDEPRLHLSSMHVLVLRSSPKRI